MTTNDPELKAINGAALAILADARSAGDADTALKAVDRIQQQIELQANCWASWTTGHRSMCW